MDMKRYFLINDKDLSRSVVNTALVRIMRQSAADTPRLTTVDVDGNYYATTMSIGQMNLFHDYVSSLNVKFKMLTEPPTLGKARVDDQPTTTRQATPQEAADIDEIVQHVGKIFDHVGKLFDSLGKPE